MSQSRPSPLSVRFTNEEKVRLKALAGDVPIGTYIRNQALAGDATPRSRRSRAPLKDGNALGQVLGLLGQSRIANNLNQLARAVNLGTLPVDQELETDLREACAHIRTMRELLLKALGMSIIENVRTFRPVSRAFRKAASEHQP